MQPPDPTPYPIDHLSRRSEKSAAAIITRSEVIDFGTLDVMVGRLATALKARDLAPGDRVATWLGKTPLACAMPLAAARAGLVHVPVNPALKRAQVAHILGDSGALLLVTGAGRVAALEAGDLPAACALWMEEEAEAVRGEPLPPSEADPDTLAALLYTSGSTGRPKGVMLSHANLWLGAVSVAHYLRLEAHDATLAILPLSFDYGQNQLFSAWKAGSAVVPLDYLTARDVIRAVERHGVTTLAGVPPLWVQLLEAVWPVETAAKLRRITNSGGALTETLVRRLRGTFPNAGLYPMYGLTEAFRSTFLAPELVDAHPTSIGRAIPFADVMVVDAQGERVSEGELVHAGPLVAKGYWRDPERTAARFRPAPAWSPSGGLAVWSGDTVRRDDEGLLHFVGRDDEMIKTAGNRVSPAEIEEVALSSGHAAEAVALGISDERLGQAIVLVVRGTGDDAALAAHMRVELPAFMQPKSIIWRDVLPHNANGKLDRAALRAEMTA